MPLGFRFDYQGGQFTKAGLILEQKIERAATNTIREAAQLAKDAGRKAIAAGGFSSRWQNALRAKVYPQSGTSLHPAAYIYHKIPYANVFQTGETIEGKPLMWLPTENVPIDGSGHRPAPAELVGPFGKLILINEPGKHPFLAIEVTAKAPGPWGSAKMRAGRLRQGGYKRGQKQLIPMYIGVPQVTDPKKFDVKSAIESVTTHLDELFAKHLEAGE